jgi:hypothetical protein
MVRKIVQAAPKTEEEYYDNMPMKDRMAEVAMKILSGQLLTQEEYFLALASKSLMPNQAMKDSYAGFKLAHYEDDKIRGFLCISKGKINSEEHLGENTMCLFGIHREQVKPEHLREDQKELW